MSQAAVDIAKRSKRYRIAVRPDSQEQVLSVPISRYGDPVNFHYPTTNSGTALDNRARFLNELSLYKEADEESPFYTRSVPVIASRLNRLLRLFDQDPIPPQELSLALTGSLYESVSLNTTLGISRGKFLIPAARIAEHSHPWYGTLYHDADFFESLIDNWKTDVLGTQVSIDANHRQFSGLALGWVENMWLDYEMEVFNLMGTPTPTGEQVLGSELKYASIEYATNYRDSETGVSYGPVLIATAATNTPFVTRNQPISFVPASYGQSKAEGAEGNEGSAPKFNGGISMTGKKEDPQADQAQVLTVNGRSLTAEDVAALLAQVESQGETIKQAAIDAVVSAALERGVAPVVVNLAKQVLGAANPEATPTIELKTTHRNEDGESVESTLTVNYFGAIKALLELIPGKVEAGQVAKTKDSETEQPRQQTSAGAPSASGRTPDGDMGLVVHGKDNMTLEEAEDLARKRRARYGSNGNIPEAEL